MVGLGGRPDGLWLEMRGWREDGLEVFILMESIRSKCHLYPNADGIIPLHGEGALTFLCFSSPDHSVAPCGFFNGAQAQTTSDEPVLPAWLAGWLFFFFKQKTAYEITV